jgi:hypothetical protein
MENQTEVTPLWQHALKFGIIFSLSIVIVDLSFFIFGVYRGDHPVIDLIIGLITSVAIIFFGMKTRRDSDFHGFSKYTEVLKTGLFIGVFASIVIALWKFLYYSYINPEELLREFETGKKAILELSFDEDKKMEIIEAIRKENTAKAKLSGQFIAVNVYVLILSLLIAIFVQKPNPKDAYKELDS